MPTQPTPQTEQSASMEFPLRGIDSSNEYELQPAGTTPVARNVRAYEALTLRGRGGSRAGLGRFLDDQLDGPVQCLELCAVASPDSTLVNVGGGGDGGGSGGFITGGGANTTGGAWTPAGTTGAPSYTGFSGGQGAGTPTDGGGYLTKGGGIIDPSNDTLYKMKQRRLPRNPNPKVRWRRGGSARTRVKRPQQKRKQTPAAVNDSISCFVGDPPITIDVLANDKYIGVPSVRLLRNTSNLGKGASIETTGKGTDTRVVFTPPSKGNDDQYQVDYELVATGNAGKAQATINITVSKEKKPPVAKTIGKPGDSGGSDPFVWSYDGGVQSIDLRNYLDRNAYPFLEYQGTPTIRFTALSALGVPILSTWFSITGSILTFTPGGDKTTYNSYVPELSGEAFQYSLSATESDGEAQSYIDIDFPFAS